MHTCVTGGSLVCLHAAITSGVGKNVSYRANSSSGKEAVFLSGNKSMTFSRIHSSSLVTHADDWVVYCSQMKNQGGKHSLLNVASINLFTALLFVPWSKTYIGDGTVIIGRGIGLKCRPQTLVLIRRLKAQWERALVMNGTQDGSSPEAVRQEAECIRMITELISYKPLSL
jgi:hypothetical protein